MKIGKACILAVSSVAVSAAFAEVKYGDNNWQAVAGVYSGCITNGAHWSRGSVPDVSIDGAVTNYQAGVFTVHPGVPYTVSFPTGNFECAGGLYIKLAEGDDITFDGTDTLFRHAPAPWDRYPYRIAIGTSKLAYILDTNWREGGNGQLSNFTYRVAMSGNTASLELQKGLYDYITDSHAFSPSLFADASTLQRASVVLGDGVNVRCGALLVYAQTAAENILAATGSAITVSSDVSVVGTSGKKVAVSLADSSFSSTGFNVSGGEIDVVFDSVSARLAGMNMGNGSRIGWSVRDSFITNSNTSGVSFKLGAVAGANTTAVDITDSEVYFLRNVDLGVTNAAASLTLCVTNSVFSKLPKLSNSAGYIILSGDTLFDLSSSTTVCACVEIGGGEKISRLHLSGKSMMKTDVTNCYLGREGGGEMVLEDEAGFTVSGASIYLGATSSKVAAGSSLADMTPVVTGRLVVAENSSFTVAGSRLAAGNTYGAVGVIEVSGNAELRPGSAALQVGRWGTGFVTLSGGSIVDSAITVAGDVTGIPPGTETAESVFVQTGGSISSRDNDDGISVALQSGRKGRVRLEGGVAQVSYVRGGAGATVAGGGGWAAFEADGGRVVAQKAMDDFIGGFDEALLGGKGLVVESDFDVTIPQHFSDKQGASGEGRLVFTGSGTRTLSATASAPSVIEIASGELVFAAGAAMPRTLVVTNGAIVTLTGAVTLENLVVGTADTLGVLRIDPTTRITVTGSLDIRNMQLELVGDFPAETSYDIFTCAAGLDEDILSSLYASFVRSGLATGTSCGFSAVTGEDGAATLKFSVETGDTIRIELDEGEETHSTNILWHSSKTLQTDVAEGAALTLSGRLGFGELEKTGAGVLYLTGLSSMFYPGLLLSEGLLSVSDPRQLGNDGVQVVSGPRLAGGMLEVTGSQPVSFDSAFSVEATNSHGLVEIYAATDVTMPMPSVTQGALRKRGPGTLVLEASDNDVTYAYSTHSENSYNEDMSAYNGFTVQEGELVFRGTKPGITNSLTCNIDVGVPGEAYAEGKVQPGLVIDNIDLALTSYRKISLGPYVINHSTKASDGALLANANSFVTDPYLIVSNNAVFRFGYMSNMSGTEGAHYRHLLGAGRVTVDGATILCNMHYATGSVAGAPSLSCKGAVGCYGFQRFVNGAALRSYRVTVNGTSSVRFEDSFLGGYSAAMENVPTIIDHGTNEATSHWEIVRSEFCVSQVAREISRYKSRYGHIYVFEDSLWSCGDSDLKIGSTNVNMNIYVRGGGLRLAPYEGRTYEVIRKIRGDGAVVMDGPGTLRFGRSQYLNVEQADPIDLNSNLESNLDETGTELYDPCTVCYTGGTVVNGGTVDFGGFSVADMRLSGKGGTVRNAAFSGATIANTNLTFGADVSFGGTTKFDFSGFDADDGDNLAIGRYEGAAPDVSTWRGRNFARKGLKAVFTAEDGVITAEVTAGTFVIVR